MDLPEGVTVAVADGQKLSLFRNSGDAANPKLEALPEPSLSSDNKGSGSRHHNSSANPSGSQLEEDSFAAATAAWLNQQVLGGKIDQLVVIAAPRTLGELRKHYHKKLSDKLLGELAKDLTGQTSNDIEAALAKA